MAGESTNKWTLSRSRASVNALLKKAGMEPLLVEVLSDLLWVVDHQQDQLEAMSMKMVPGGTPTVGRIVQYTLNAQDAAEINRRRHPRRPDSDEGAQFHVGNVAHEGDVLPMLICRVWSTIGGGDASAVNGQVFLDGNDTLWVTSRVEGTGQGNWSWPEPTYSVVQD